ncbi:DUF5999 family protein [Microtetraspora malaysiensis]|uniref:DUF5999 family protein n=1 Tax=Microtetraspora malaysiensis TaxID=161358 RepID=UPI003D939E47
MRTLNDRRAEGRGDAQQSLRSNGVVVFDDTGELLPDGRSIPAHRAAYAQAA